MQAVPKDPDSLGTTIAAMAKCVDDCDEGCKLPGKVRQAKSPAELALEKQVEAAIEKEVEDALDAELGTPKATAPKTPVAPVKTGPLKVGEACGTKTAWPDLLCQEALDCVDAAGEFADMKGTCQVSKR